MADKAIFKAYDIRGIYGKELDDDLAYKLGLAYCTMRAAELKDRKKITVVVGSDMRLSSPSMKAHLIEGLTDGGFNVVDIGLASTPTFYFAVASFGYDGGILVSASHNPKEYNGFKLVRDRAIPISQDSGMFVLRDLVFEGKLVKAKEKGTVKSKLNVVAEQVVHDLPFADLSKIKPLKVVIDTANSMGATYFDPLFEKLPCRLVRMNWKLDGTFPSHQADPFKYENVKDLCERVVKEKADLGIATDGDGDRIFFVDDKGIPVEPGILRAVLSKVFLKDRPKSKICYDIRPGRITQDTIIENGGIPIVTRVGHSLIKEAAIKEKAYFAGESSGHFFLNMDEGCYEIPMIVTLKILQELSVADVRASVFLRPYQRYFHSGEINFVVKDPKKKIEDIKKDYKDAKQNELDGISVEYKDWWFNVRASNTEPLLRLNLEAVSKDIMETKRDELKRLITL